MSSINWSGWSKVGRPGLHSDTILGDPVVIRNKNGHRELFCIGSDQLLWHLPENGIWAGLGRPFEGFAFNPRSKASVEQNQDGRLEVFVLGDSPGSKLWHIWQVEVDHAWSHWDVLDVGAPQGGFSHRTDQPDSTLAVGRNQDGRLEVFTLGAADGNVWQVWQTAPNNGWSAWKSLGQPVVSIEHIAVSRNLDGRQEVFVKSGFAHIWQTSPNNGWSQWKNEDVPTDASPFSRFQVARNKDGRLQVFLLDANHLWSTWQTAPNNGWSQWNEIANSPSKDLSFGDSLAAVQNIDGALEVFAAEKAGSMWHICQTTPGGKWSDWHSIGKPSRTEFVDSPHFFAIDRHGDGKLEVFANISQDMWHVSEL